MNHKRRRPKHQRNGCDCKYWKDERMPRGSPRMQKPADRRTLQVNVPKPYEVRT